MSDEQCTQFITSHIELDTESELKAQSHCVFTY